MMKMSDEVIVEETSLSFVQKAWIIAGIVTVCAVVLLVANSVIYKATHKDPLCENSTYRASNDVDAVCDIW